MAMGIFLRTAVSLIGLALLVTTRSASAIPQTMIIAQNTIKELYCPGSTSSIVPTWNVSGGIVQGNYQPTDLDADFLKEVLSIEIDPKFNDDFTVLNSTLRINGSVANNGTTLTCTTDLIEIVVTVMVQGVLSAPSRIEPTTDSTTILLCWDPPFTLDITDEDPDIVGYTVYCTNRDTGMREEANVTEPVFSFTGMQGESPDPCHEYEFRVSAWNVVGESNKSSVLQTCFRGEAPQPVTAMAEVKSSDLILMSIYFTVTIVDISCHGRLPESIAVTITVDGRVMPVHTHEIEYGELVDFEMVDFEIPDLPTGNLCNATITAKNQIGTSQPIDITFDCQPSSSGTSTDDTENTPQPENKLIIPVAVGVCAAAGCVVILSIALLCIIKCSRENKVDTSDLEKPAEDNVYTDVPSKPEIPHYQTTTLSETSTQERQLSTSSAESQTPFLTDSQDQEKREQLLLYAELQQQPNFQPAPPPSQPVQVQYVQIRQTDGE